MKGKLDELLGADVRALAVLRIGLALIILVDLAQRSTDLVAHYTDFGVLPRADLLAVNPSRWLVSIHLMSGVWQVQALLFAAAAICAFALLVGYRTRLATFASWLLFTSLNTRNPVVVLGADVLIRVVLFWAMFLPLGARCSVDIAVLRSPEPGGPRILSAASAAYLVQMVLVYVFTALRKSDPEWRTEGTALYYALSLEHLTTPLGQWLLHIRVVTVLGFVLMHAGIYLTLRIGLFPWIAALSLVVFLPSWVWDRWLDPARPFQVALRLLRVSRLWEAGQAFMAEQRGRASSAGAVKPMSGAGAAKSAVVGITVAGLLFYVLLWNISALASPRFRLPEPVRSVGYLLRLDQTWSMFAPSPLKDEGWYVIPGRLRNGQTVDLFRDGGQVRWDRPPSIADTYRNARWRRYMMLLTDQLEYAPGFARYLCAKWNRTHDAARRLEDLEIVFVVERTLPDYRRAEPRRVLLFRQTCT